MKWYNFETSFITLKNELRGFLVKNGIKYELSDASGAGYRCYHFEILTDCKGAEKINNFIDSVSITAEEG